MHGIRKIIDDFCSNQPSGKLYKVMFIQLLLPCFAMLLCIDVFAQPQFSLGANTYYYQTSLVLPERTYHSMGEYEDESGVGVAGFIQLHLGGFSIRVEGTKVNYAFSSDRVNIPPFFEPEKYAEVGFAYSVFELPILGIYHFGVGTFQPYIGTGVNVGFNGDISFSETIYNFEDFRGDVFYDEIDYSWEENTTGFIVLVGLAIRLTQNINVKIGGRYTGNASVANVFQTTSFVTNDSFGLGVTSYRTNRFQGELTVEYNF